MPQNHPLSPPAKSVVVELDFMLGCEHRVRLKYRLEPAGDWIPHGLFMEYLDREGKPHLTFMAAPNPKQDGRFTPHFTNPMLSGPERRTYLARVLPVDLEQGMRAIMDRASEAWVAGLAETTLGALSDAGWCVIGAREPALQRWVRRGLRGKRNYSLGAENMWALARHALRHSVDPTRLALAPKCDLWLAWRFTADEIEFGQVMIFEQHLEDGRTNSRQPRDWRCAWTLDSDQRVMEALATVVPMDELRATSQRILEQLEQLPTLTAGEPIAEADLPAAALQIAGYFLPYLIGAALEDAASRVEVPAGKSPEVGEAPAE